MSENVEVSLVRPTWAEEQYHRDQLKDVTVLICQRKTRDLIQLCLESLLHHYPEIKVLVVDGNSQDASSDYLKFMACIYPNLKVWERKGRNSHGETMHEAVSEHIDTPLVVLMDSDTKVMRHGFIEGMLQQFHNDPKLYATGSLMLVTRMGEACGAPKDESDVLRYAHPSCSMYHVETYKALGPKAQFGDHGAPCVHTMIAAEEEGLHIGYFPIDKYVMHLCGASWQVIPTVWYHDDNVQLRPLVTFLVTNKEQVDMLREQEDHDFDIITTGPLVIKEVATYEVLVNKVTNYVYDVRFKVQGRYICVLPEHITTLDPDYVKQLRLQLTREGAPEKCECGGLLIHARQYWQKYLTLI